MALTTPRWRVSSTVSLLDWGGELVAYSDLTGNTLLLDEQGALIVDALRSAPFPLSLQELAVAIVAPEEVADALPLLEGLLDELLLCEVLEKVLA